VPVEREKSSKFFINEGPESSKKQNNFVMPKGDDPENSMNEPN
jgi:hypothetical protein